MPQSKAEFMQEVLETALENTMYSAEYKALQEQFHNERPDYGVSGQRYANMVLDLSKQLATRDILDYGCGKCTLSNNLPFPIHNYDPFIPVYSTRPEEADIVVCTDVMEHVEPEYLNDVCIDIAKLSRKAALFQIATRPASKSLPDGRNAHLTVQPASWWLRQLLHYFEPVNFQTVPGGFVILCFPKGKEADA